MKDKENIQQPSKQTDSNADAEKKNVAQEANVSHNPLDNNEVDDEGYDIVESGLGIDE